MNRIAVFLSILALAGCGSAPAEQAQAVDLGAEVTLAPGAALVSAELKVRFVGVTEDSRCPRDVTCVWAGEVKVALEIQESSKVASTVEILERASTVAGAYRVSVVRVEPAVMTGVRIAPQDYRATLTIDKVG